MTDLAIYATPLPFNKTPRRILVLEGMTINEIVEVAVPVEFRDFSTVVFLDGRPILPNQWGDIKPNLGQVVNVSVVPQGGGGKKSPIATIISIAAMVAAPYLATTYGVALASAVTGVYGPVTATQAFLAGAAIRGAVGLAGMLLSNAIAPPPKQKSSGNVENNITESQTQFIEGAGNNFQPFGVVPVCLGTNRMFPPQCARPFTEASGKNNFVRQMFCWGFGEKILLSDFKIGETDLSDFKDISIQHRLRGDLHLGTSLYSEDVYQEDYNILLSEPDGFTLRTTRPDVDEVEIDVTFPRGLTEFNQESGKRMKRQVTLEARYAPTGTSDWSVATSAYKSFGSTTLAVEKPDYSPQGRGRPGVEYIGGVLYRVGYRKDLIVIDKYSGARSIIKNTYTYVATGYTNPQLPELPFTKIRLGTVTSRVKRLNSGVGVESFEIVSFTDDRASALFGKEFQNSSSFDVGTSGTNVTIAAGGLSVNEFDFYEATAESLRRSVNIVFPENGTYDIQIRRITDDSSSDRILDLVYLTAIKSIKHQLPVALEGINGTAIKIRGTDQLNGAIDQFNATASNVIDDYDAANDEWVPRATSNPASIYRYVLQGGAFAKPLTDSQIILSDLEAWHTYCQERGYAYDKVIDYETNIDEVLADVASAGSASPDIKDGKRTIVVDKIKDEIVQIITPRNSWGYSAQIVLPDLPHALRMGFRNRDRGYVSDEVTVYLPGYNASNATEFETIDLGHCTSYDLAYQHGKRYIQTGLLRFEQHQITMDFENICFTRGDRVLLAHDVPILTVGQARIKSLVTSGSPAELTSITVDDVVAIPDSATYYARIRKADGTLLYEELTTTVGETTTLVFRTPLTSGFPEAGDLLYVVETGQEQDCIVRRIEPAEDLTARVYLDNYAPEIFTVELEDTPTFDSNITVPLEFRRPEAPQLATIQSDEDVGFVSSDGSFSSRAVITLININSGSITPIVNVRVSGTGTFNKASVIEANPERVVITGLEDGTNYDIHIAYRRSGGVVISKFLEINNYKFEGASAIPADVQNFVATVSGDTLFLDWDNSEELDHKSYIVKYSASYSDASWNTAQTLRGDIRESRLVLPFLGGTYLIKDVDILGNESANATAIITYNPGTIRPVVETLTEHPTFSGTLDNITVGTSGIYLTDPSLGVGYYYFDTDIDFGEVYTAFRSAKIKANAIIVNDIFDMVDIFAETDLFGSANNDIFAMDDIFAEGDLFGIGSDSWSVELQEARTNDDPTSSPSPYGSWEAFVPGSLEFRASKYRLKLSSLGNNVSPLVSELEVVVDMPDRIERGEDLTVTSSGYTVTYTPAFKNNPSVSILLQNGATDDKIEFVSKTSSSFTFKVYNATTAGYVTRSFDYIASGYGKVQV